jgi:hypothetical protein
MDAYNLRVIIEHAVIQHPDIASCKPVQTVWTDRLALAVEDRNGQLWRVHVLREPVEVVS